METIYVGKGWSLLTGVESDNMFYLCRELKGQAGTVYDEALVDATYARIDEAGKPGYLSVKPEGHEPGWFKDDSGMYVYYNELGQLVTNGWVPFDGGYYYADMNGHVLTCAVIRYGDK